MKNFKDNKKAIIINIKEINKNFKLTILEYKTS